MHRSAFKRAIFNNISEVKIIVRRLFYLPIFASYNYLSIYLLNKINLKFKSEKLAMANVKEHKKKITYVYIYLSITLNIKLLLSKEYFFRIMLHFSTIIKGLAIITKIVREYGVRICS